jgi:hypothetical protein
MQHADRLADGQKAARHLFATLTPMDYSALPLAGPIRSPSAKTLVIGDDEKSHPDLSAGSALGRIALLPIQTLNRPLAALEAMPNLNVA